MSHVDTHKLALVRCRGVRRIHLRTNAPVCVRAPDSHLRLICAWLIATRKLSVLFIIRQQRVAWKKIYSVL